MATNSEFRDGRGESDGHPTDPVVFAVYERREQYPVGVPYDRVVQVIRERLGMERAAAVREIQATVGDDKLERVRGDRLTLP